MRISDWSSDVCSSDLSPPASASRARTSALRTSPLSPEACAGTAAATAAAIRAKRADLHVRIIGASAAFGGDPVDILGGVLDFAGLAMDAILGVDHEFEIGQASCRERVWSVR